MLRVQWIRKYHGVEDDATFAYSCACRAFGSTRRYQGECGRRLKKVWRLREHSNRRKMGRREPPSSGGWSSWIIVPDDNLFHTGDHCLLMNCGRCADSCRLWMGREGLNVWETAVALLQNHVGATVSAQYVADWLLISTSQDIRVRYCWTSKWELLGCV